MIVISSRPKSGYGQFEGASNPKKGYRTFEGHHQIVNQLRNKVKREDLTPSLFMFPYLDETIAITLALKLKR